MTPLYNFKRDVLWLDSSSNSPYSIPSFQTTGGHQVDLLCGDGFTASLPLPLVLATSSILQSILLSSNQCCGSVGVSLPAVRGTTLVLIVELLRKGETAVLTGTQNSGERLKE